MRLVIFSGTTEGRMLAEELTRLGGEVLVSVATEEGRGQHSDAVLVHQGRLTETEMEALLTDCDLCVDATHPYAVEVSRNIKGACRKLGLTCLRLLRKESSIPARAVVVNSAREAAEFLQHTTGNILLTTGAKELASYREIDPRRLYPRVLPVISSLEQCQALQIPTRQIIAMQGPFTAEMNLALLHQYDIRWLVTKDGGTAGGFPEKAEAARLGDVSLLVISRPEEQGKSYEEVFRECVRQLKLSYP